MAGTRMTGDAMEQLPATTQAGGPVGMRGRDSVTGGGPDSGSNEYLTFAIDSQSYGLDILSVREIRACTAVTNLPHTPDFLRGIINLHCGGGPIFHLPARLGRGPTAPTPLH